MFVSTAYFRCFQSQSYFSSTTEFDILFSFDDSFFFCLHLYGVRDTHIGFGVRCWCSGVMPSDSERVLLNL